jgi:trehalose 6-phosphate phosphatase
MVLHRMTSPEALPSAWDALPGWLQQWREHACLVLLLDFDGTLAPIVERPEAAAMPADTRVALERLLGRADIEAALISGRGMADVRERAALPGIAYAGNHGMEIHGPGVERIHPDAKAARPALERMIDTLSGPLGGIPGAILEDKGLTLSVHDRMVAAERRAEIAGLVRQCVEGEAELRITEGKRVLEVRPRIDWHKGKAVEFLLDEVAPPAGAPVLYLGDDTTDEDAFGALRERNVNGGGVLVAEAPPPFTLAGWGLRDPAEVGRFLATLADATG